MAVDRRTMIGGAAMPLLGVPGEGPERSRRMTDERYRRGLAELEKVAGPAGASVVESLADIAPDLGRYIVEFAYGDIFARPGLDTRRGRSQQLPRWPQWARRNRS